MKCSFPAYLLFGAALGLAFGFIVLGTFIRGPGDPFGYLVGPAMGGFLGLVIALMTSRGSLIRRTTRADSDKKSWSLDRLDLVVTATVIAVGIVGLLTFMAIALERVGVISH